MAQFSDEQMLQPVLPGGWTVKDALAHIAWWERRAHSVLSAITAGLEPEFSLEEGDVDGVNRNTYETNRLIPLADVRCDEADAYRSLFALVESLPDEALDNPSKFAWTKGRPLSTVVEWNTFAHYDEHMPDLHKALNK